MVSTKVTVLKHMPPCKGHILHPSNSASNDKVKQNQYTTTVQSGEVHKKHTTGDYGQVGAAHISDRGLEVKATDVVRSIVKWLGESNEIQH